MIGELGHRFPQTTVRLELYFCQKGENNVSSEITHEKPFLCA